MDSRKHLSCQINKSKIIGVFYWFFYEEREILIYVYIFFVMDGELSLKNKRVSIIKIGPKGLIQLFQERGGGEADHVVKAGFAHLANAGNDSKGSFAIGQFKGES